MEKQYARTEPQSDGNSELNGKHIEKKESIFEQNSPNNNNSEPNRNQNSLENNDNSQSNTGAIILNDNSKMEIPKNQFINNDNNEITIENVLENDDYINDLKSNPRSRFIELITSDNIKKLIDWCLLPPDPGSNTPPNQLRYPHYSCQILCSSLVLLFSKSITNIIKANKAKNKNNDDKKNSSKNSSQMSSFKSSNKDNNKYSNGNLETIKEEEIEYNLGNEEEENNFDDYFKFNQNFEKEDKFPDNTETEIRKEKVSKKARSEYNKEEKKIVNEILDEIFVKLDYIKKEDQTYMGYFQKIINYILLNEFEHISYYLFEREENNADNNNKEDNNKDSQKDNNALKRLYKHLDQAAIQIILENLLNILFDNQNKSIRDTISKYNNIIKDVVQELKNDENYEKSQCICELIVSTLINNSENQLIKLVLNKNKNENIIIQLKDILNNFLIKDNPKKEKNKNYDKLIIGIIQILYQLNNTFINSFYKHLYDIKNNNYSCFSLDTYKNKNTFEYQYICKNEISLLHIFEAYKNNYYLYLDELFSIYNIIKENIKKNYNEKKNNINEKTNLNIFGLKNIFQWKLISSILKINVYSYITLGSKINIEKTKDLADEKLFKILIQYYFEYPKNNMYQNIFIEIINLICIEKCPECFIKPFLKIKNNKRNKFLYKIIKNIKDNTNNKYKLSRGTNIQILKLFYTSLNPYISNCIEKYSKDNKIKNLFMNSINDKLERKILDELEYSDSEIFNSDNENNDTFDGNDVNLPRKFISFNKTIVNFLEKCKDKKQSEENEKRKIKFKSKDYEFDNNINTIIENIAVIEYENNNEFGLARMVELKSEEKLIYDDISSDFSDN